MRCTNCGLPLSPTSNASNCPRCGAPLNAFQGAAQQQFEQAGWGNGGGMPPQQTPWGQAASPGSFNAFPQQGQFNQGGFNSPGMSGFNQNMGASPMVPRRPAPPPQRKATPRTLFMVAGLCLFVGALILGLVAVLSFSGNGKGSPNTANNNGNGAQPQATSATQAAAPTSTASASPTAGASPTATGTAYPGQQYVYGAQMVASAPTSAQQQQPATSFKVGSNMYVVFSVHPPSQGGVVCSYWYLNGNQVTTYPQQIKSTSTFSYTYAIYSSPGQAYVELYWASDKTCADKVLAQHVDFTVTN